MDTSPGDVVEKPPTLYLAVFGAVICTILLLVLLSNYLIDPYLNHQWGSPLLQRLRPAREKLAPWGKTYAVFKYQPQVLYAGNSRTEAALPADPQLFGGKRVFNGALSGASLGDAIAMLQHARSVAPLDTVVWGVDYGSFSLENGNSEFDRNLVAYDPYYAARRALLDLKRALSFDMTLDSIDVMTGQVGAVCRSYLVLYGQRDEACSIANLADRGGTAKALIGDVQRARNKNEKTALAMTAFQVELELLCKADIHVMLYVNPLHALTVENFLQQGYGAELDQWTRRLVHATDPARLGGCNIQLFDFSGFNSVTSERIPQVSGQAMMQNYWEGSHYRTVVGRQILAKMIPLAGVTVPVDFGVKLDLGNLEAHLARRPLERAIYRRKHPQELVLLDQWFGPVPATPTP